MFVWSFSVFSQIAYVLQRGIKSNKYTEENSDNTLTR